MDTSNILKPTKVVNQKISAKIGRLISAWLLSEVILVGAVFNFLDRLNEKGILGMGDGFTSIQLFWGDGILMNIFRLIIVILSAGFFGFLYGYLSKKVSTSEKIIVNAINTFLAIFGTVFVVFVALAIFQPEVGSQMNEGLSLIINVLTSSPFYLTFLLLQIFGIFGFGFLCVKFGSKIINNPYYTIDKEKRGTLLDIKWYHFLWLWMPMGAYSQIALNLIYITGHTIITFIRDVHWFEFLGAVSSDSGSDNISIAWGKFFLIYIVAIISYYLLVYLREVLIGEKKINNFLKILVFIGIGLVFPVILLLLLGS